MIELELEIQRLVEKYGDLSPAEMVGVLIGKVFDLLTLPHEVARAELKEKEKLVGKAG